MVLINYLNELACPGDVCLAVIEYGTRLWEGAGAYFLKVVFCLGVTVLAFIVCVNERAGSKADDKE